MCLVNTELLEFSQGQDGGPTETISEAPGTYGFHSRSNAIQTFSYEAASALSSRPSPEMGVASLDDHSSLLPSFQPVVGPHISTCRSYLGHKGPR